MQTCLELTKLKPFARILANMDNRYQAHTSQESEQVSKHDSKYESYKMFVTKRAGIPQCNLQHCTQTTHKETTKERAGI